MMNQMVSGKDDDKYVFDLYMQRQNANNQTKRMQASGNQVRFNKPAATEERKEGSRPTSDNN